MNTLSNFFSSVRGKLFLVVFFLHAAVAVLLASNVIVIPSAAIDHLTYHQEATQIAQLLHAGTYTVGAVYAHHWYPFFVALLYFVFGSHLIVGMIVNALLAAGSALLFFGIVKKFAVSEKIAFWASAITFCAYASFMYQSSMLLKESWIVFLLLYILSAAAALTVQERFSVWKFVLVLISFVALRNLRFFIGFAAIAGFFTAWFFVYETTLKKRLLYGIGMIAIVTAVSLAFTGNGVAESPSVTEYLQPQRVHELRNTYFKNGATKANISVVTETPRASSTTQSAPEKEFSFSMSGIIRAALTVVVGPFSTQLSLQRYVYAGMDLVWWYPTLILSLIGIAVTRWKRSIPYLVAAAIIIAGVSVGADNLGALMRYRIPAFIVVSLFVATGAVALRMLVQKQRAHL